MKKSDLIRITIQEANPGQTMRRAKNAEHQVSEGLRQMLSKERIALQGALREEAPKGPHGKFARSIRTLLHKDPATGQWILEGFVSEDMAWLNRIIIHGSRPHRIPTGGAAAQMAKGYPLRFYWENGPNGPGIYYYWTVWHPGTKPNPYPSRALGERRRALVAGFDRYGASIGSVWVQTR